MSQLPPTLRGVRVQLGDRARSARRRNVSLSTSVPMWNDTLGAETLVPEGYSFPPGEDSATVFMSRIDEHYFDALGIQLLKGRSFTINDDVNASHAIELGSAARVPS